MKFNFFLFFTVITFCLLSNLFAQNKKQPKTNLHLQPSPAAWLAPYNIVWDSPSNCSANSMPLTGLNLGVNVWVQDGDVLLLVGSPNCLDEKGMQTKLGLIRLRFQPAIFVSNFRQELDLGKSAIIISGKTAAGKKTQVVLNCPMNKTALHVGVNAQNQLIDMTVQYETWSNYEVKSVNGGFRWSRRLTEKNERREKDIKSQGMSEFASNIPDPLSGLTEGAQVAVVGKSVAMEPAVAGEGLFNNLKTKTFALKTAKPVHNINFVFTFRMEQDKSRTEWEKYINRDAVANAIVATMKADNTASASWWKSFWNRSSITISRAPGLTPENDKAWQAARNYQLIRYTFASNTSSRAMTLFNGGNFTCTGNPDIRNWEFCQFMAQNQRLVYWPMLRAGDFDMLKVAGDFYRDRTEMSRQHAKKFWGVDGVAYCEAFSIFGLSSIGTTADGRCDPPHLNYHYTSGMEFALMMLEHGNYSGQYLQGYTEPAMGIISYYDQYYQKTLEKKTGKPLDETGHLVIYPSDACEPYHGCTNNTDVIAGLDALSRTLLLLPQGKLDAEKRKYIEAFRKRIPEYPLDEKDGHQFYKAAKSWENVMYNGNMDFPQMYICFPFTTLSLGRSDMSLAKNTWKYSAVNEPIQHQNQCWYQTSINFSRMGETVDAAKSITEKLLFNSMRFPNFYHTYYSDGKKEFCHVPDTDHAGVAMTALQEMIMQTDGDRILLGAAWPAEWNGNFKLHAPLQTEVVGHIAGGKVIVDKVTPESRRKDIEIFPLKPIATK